MTEVQSFLGFTNYYHKFIPKYVQIARPINQLVSGENASKKKALVEWTEECQVAFEHLRHLCSQTPILAYANHQKPFKLHTGAREHGLGAVLYQKQDDDMECVIAYARRTLSKSERNYDTHKLEFLALKWSIMERFHEYLYGGHFEVYTDNNLLTYILTTAKLDARGHRWVASLANYNFKIFCKSGKLNVEADVLSHIPWESTQVEHMEPLIVKTMLQSKLESIISLPGEYFLVNSLLKSMTIDTTLKLTQKDWVKEQMDDVDINRIVQLLKSNELSTFMAQEMDSSIGILLRCKKDLFLKNELLYQKAILKNHPEPVAQFVLPKRFIRKVILARHDDNGHLGMEQMLRLLQERFFWPKMAEDVCTHICTCEMCLRFKQPQERAEMQPILVSYSMELIHLDFLTLGGKTEDAKSTNILVITDHFTKYAQAYITPRQTAIVVSHTLWENFLVHYGWLEKILTDQGKSFENNLFLELCSLAQVKKLCTSPNHPETNGQCKHFNATLINMLGTLPSQAKKN